MTDLTQPPRSLHVIGGKGSGGAERFAVRLVNALARSGQPVAAVTVAGGEIARAIDPAVRQYDAPMLGVWDRYSRWKINRAIADFRPDVVQTYLGRATRIVRLTHKHPVHLARLGGYYKLRGYRHAHAWVGNTQGLCDHLVANGFDATRVTRIGNFVDAPPTFGRDEQDALRTKYNLDGCRVIAGVGRLHPVKGWDDLLQAFARLPAALDGQPLCLLAVGDGPLRKELEQLAAGLGIADRVRWAGWQDQPAALYQLADVFVCSSVSETLGNVILEAWTNRTLVVSTRAQGPLELIEDGVNGLLAPLSDPAGLAAVLNTALTLDPAQRARMIEAGEAEVARHYSEAAIVAAYIGLYARLRDQACGRP